MFLTLAVAGCSDVSRRSAVQECVGLEAARHARKHGGAECTGVCEALRIPHVTGQQMAKVNISLREQGESYRCVGTYSENSTCDKKNRRNRTTVVTEEGTGEQGITGECRRRENGVSSRKQDENYRCIQVYIL